MTGDPRVLTRGAPVDVESPYDLIVDRDDELLQIAERQLAEAEKAYRSDPSPANQRRIVKRWGAVREARGAQTADEADLPLWLTRPRSPLE
jgi:hypothetical protein